MARAYVRPAESFRPPGNGIPTVGKTGVRAVSCGYRRLLAWDCDVLMLGRGAAFGNDVRQSSMDVMRGVATCSAFEPKV